MATVIRSLALHQLMSRLALAAVLLLLALPTTGRVMGAAAQADGAWAQMCTLAGMQLVKIPLADPGPTRPVGEMPMDCDYCPLLGALTALLLWVVLAFPRPAARLAAVRSAPPRYGLGHPSGLGSRGPPIAL